MKLCSENKKIAVLGSTGSVGRQTLEIARYMKIPITVLSADSNIKLLEQQAREFNASYCAVRDEKSAAQLKLALADTPIKVLSGEEGIKEAASLEDTDTVFNSIMGKAGLVPTLAAIEAGKDIALSNKETLVAAGEIVMKRAYEKNVSIIPVDSEHSAIFQCLEREKKFKNIILTASGGPFFNRPADEFSSITLEEALAHPTWKMGKKITVDSATLMNKGFEVIEAAHLFGGDADSIKVLIHRESIIHSMVEYIDNAVIAQMSVPDMRLCIQYALTYPERHPGLTGELDLAKLCTLSFYKPDEKKFPLLPLAYYALRKGGVVPAVLNAANEAAVELFLNRKISFAQISETVSRAVEDAPKIPNPTVEDIIAADSGIREEIIGKS